MQCLGTLPLINDEVKEQKLCGKAAGSVDHMVDHNKGSEWLMLGYVKNFTSVTYRMVCSILLLEIIISYIKCDSVLSIQTIYINYLHTKGWAKTAGKTISLTHAVAAHKKLMCIFLKQIGWI